MILKVFALADEARMYEWKIILVSFIRIERKTAAGITLFYQKLLNGDLSST